MFTNLVQVLPEKYIYSFLIRFSREILTVSLEVATNSHQSYLANLTSCYLPLRIPSSPLFHLLLSKPKNLARLKYENS